MRALLQFYNFAFAEALHNVAIGTMGNYQDYLKRMPSPLREIENTPVRQHMFGNPFKVNKVDLLLTLHYIIHWMT